MSSESSPRIYTLQGAYQVGTPPKAEASEFQSQASQEEAGTEKVSRRTLGSLGLSTEDVMNKTVPMRVHACVLGTVPISFRLSVINDPENVNDHCS